MTVTLDATTENDQRPLRRVNDPEYQVPQRRPRRGQAGEPTETDDLPEYEVWSTYKVTGVAYVRAKTAAEAVKKALDVTANDPVQFDFSEPWGETKMRARRVVLPPDSTGGGA